MGVQYTCDVCGRAHGLSEETGSTPVGYGVQAGGMPEDWAVISISAPRERQEYEPQSGGRFVAVGPVPKAWLVCSPACAEECLDKAKGYLRRAFEQA